MSVANSEKITLMLERFVALEQEMASGADGETYVRLSKEYAELEPVVKIAKELRAALEEQSSLNEIVEAGEDAELAEMASLELDDLSEKLDKLEHQLKVKLLPKDAADDRNVILEVRAGTGGDEAALFAGDLFRMYQRYAANKGWKVEIMSASEAGVGGYKEITANISGTGPMPCSSLNPVCTGCSACPKPRRKGVFTRLPPRWRCCRRLKRLISRSKKRIFVSMCFGHLGRAGNR